MNKGKLIGLCSACMLIKAISYWRFRYWDDYADVYIPLAISVAMLIAAYAVFKENKWGYIAALVIFGLQFLSIVSFDLFSLLGGRFVGFFMILPGDTAMTLIGLTSALILILKKGLTSQHTQALSRSALQG